MWVLRLMGVRVCSGGAQEYSPRRQPWVRFGDREAPEGRKKLTPDIFLIHADFVFRQERTELVLERMFLVMFFLASDVFRNRGYVRFTYAEDSVSGLPAEFRAAFANPARGVCFYDAGDLSWGVRWARAHEDMNVVDGSINYQSGAVHFANDAAEVGEQVIAEFGFHQGSAFAGAEYEVEKDIAAGVGHFLSPLRGLV